MGIAFSYIFSKSHGHFLSRWTWEHSRITFWPSVLDTFDVCWFLYKGKIISILRIPRNELEYEWTVSNIYNTFHKIIIQYMYRFNHYIVTLSSDEFSMILLKIFACPTLDIVIDRKSNTSLTLSHHLIYLAPFCFRYEYRQNHWQ